MKKQILTLFVASLAACGMAQTTMQTALDLQPGANSFEYTEGSSVVAYWKYTATEPAMLTINPSTSCNAFVKGLVEDESTGKVDTITLKTAEYNYPRKAIGLTPGTTVYVGISGSSYNANSITVGFNAEVVTGIQGIGKGLTADDALDLKLDQTQILGNHYAQGYDQQTYYAQYAPTMNGVLVITAHSYVSGCTVNGVNASFQYESDSQSYKLKTTVKRGETYHFVLKNYDPVVLSTTMTFPQPGSIDMPFQLTEGANTLPAAAGKYYYTYVSGSEGGFAKFASDAVLTDGQAKMYESLSSLNYDSPAASSAVGSVNLRFELTRPNNTYYIMVNKVNATEGDETVDFSITPYQPGDKENTPIVLDLPTEDATISEVGTYYYAVDVPADQRYFLVVEAAETPASSYTGVSVYPQNQSYNSQYGQQKVRIVADGGSEGQRYILKWTSKETQPLHFKVYTEEIHVGDLASDPLNAVAGANTISGTGTKYYRYVATLNGKLTVTATESMTVSFPRGAGQNDGNYTAIVDGLNSTIDVSAKQAYLIRIEGAADQDVFSISEEAYQPGDARNCPLDIDGDYDLSGKKVGNLWLRYTAPKDGILTIRCDIPFASSEKIQYAKDEESAYLTAMVKSEYVDGNFVNTYEATKATAEGEAWIVNLQLSQVYDEAHLTFSLREPLPGETINSPILLEVGQTYDIPKGTYDAPVWAKIELTTDTISLKTDDYIGGYMYASMEDAKNDVSGRYLGFNSWDNGEYLGYYIYKACVDAGKEGSYYLKLTGNYSTVKMSVEGKGTATAIQQATAAEANQLTVYSLSGKLMGRFENTAAMQHLNKGVYVVKQGNTVRKVTVK